MEIKKLFNKSENNMGNGPDIPFDSETISGLASGSGSGDNTTQTKKKGRGRAKLKQEQQQVDSDEIREDLTDVLSPESVEFMVCGAADMRFISTGRKWWHSEKEERKAVSQSVSTALKYHVGGMSVKWIATTLACLHVTGFYVSKIVQDILYDRSENLEKDRKHEEKMKGAMNETTTGSTG